MALIAIRVADEHEDEAGHKGFTHLQQTRPCGHVASPSVPVTSWPCLDDAHLCQVGDGGKAGEDQRHHATVVGHAVMHREAFYKVHSKEDGGGETEEAGIAGEGDGEILPRDGASRL